MTEDITKTALAYIDDAARAKAPFSFMWPTRLRIHPSRPPGGK